MQAFLKKHGTGVGENRVKVSWAQASEREISVIFEVQKRHSRTWYGDSKFGENYKENWGLWNFDVVEAFLQFRKTEDELNAPYLEVQVSPLNQPFALVITEPRKVFHAPEKLSMTTAVELDEKNWKAEFKIIVPDELNGKLLYGGFFACLGNGPREFYALEPNNEAAPDFHRPDLFLPLGTL
jgi:hypothetical protein